MMDVTFVLEESGVAATVEVPCEANAAAAKEVACTALAVSPASVEMRIGTQVLEGTCRLQDTAFDAGVQVVLARPRFADIKCPAEYRVEECATMTLSRCGTLCVHSHESGHVGGFDTETFAAVFSFEAWTKVYGPPAISQCKTRCYLACEGCLLEVALPSGEVIRKVDGPSVSVQMCGSVVVSKGEDGVSVYDEDLTLLCSLSHEQCTNVAVSDCGGWAITSSYKMLTTRLWDVATGEAVVDMPVETCWNVALSRSASVFAVEREKTTVHFYDWSGAALRSVDVGGNNIDQMQFTPCAKYLLVAVEVAEFMDDEDTYDPDGYYYDHKLYLRQYDVSTMSCVREMQIEYETPFPFAISPCSRVVMVMQSNGVVVTTHLYPHNSEPGESGDECLQHDPQW